MNPRRRMYGISQDSPDLTPPEKCRYDACVEVDTTFEPQVDGHIFDRAEDGSECHWARVLAYDPPDRVVFSWDISPYWQLDSDPSHASEVEVRFVAESPERTRVELEHRNIDRHGPGWEGVREGVEGDAGWRLYLARYADLLSKVS